MERVPGRTTAEAEGSGTWVREYQPEADAWRKTDPRRWQRNGRATTSARQSWAESWSSPEAGDAPCCIAGGPSAACLSTTSQTNTEALAVER